MATDWTQDANCVGAWLMEVDEDPITDSSVNSNTGALKAANEPDYKTATPPDTYSVGYYRFDGTDDYISFGSPSELDNLGPLTMVTWFRGGNRYNQAMFREGQSIGGGSTAMELHCPNTTGRLRFRVQNTASSAYAEVAKLSALASNNVWYHIGVSWDGTPDNAGTELYVDGVNVATGGAGSGTRRSGSAYYKVIGGVSPKSYAYKDLDEFGMFSDVKDSTDINDMMDNGLYQEVAAGAAAHHLTLLGVGPA